MTAQELVENLDKVVSLPEVCIRINEMILSSHCSATDIGEVIAGDADLSARLLRTVNSAFYARPRPVDTISRAITIVGTHDLRDLAFMSSACQLFTGIPGDLINMTDFWHMAVCTGSIARALARQCNVLHTERLFVQGVMHDIGRLVILHQLPEQARDILLIAGSDEGVITAAEQDILGFTHTEVGFELLSHWKLPESICIAVRFHHEPSKAPCYELETSLVHIASVLGHGLSLGDYLEDSLAQIDAAAWRITGLSSDNLEPALEQVQEEVKEFFHLLFSPVGTGGRSTH